VGVYPSQSERWAVIAVVGSRCGGCTAVGNALTHGPANNVDVRLGVRESDPRSESELTGIRRAYAPAPLPLLLLVIIVMWNTPDISIIIAHMVSN
jgi:hypothetical protein